MTFTAPSSVAGWVALGAATGLPPQNFAPSSYYTFAATVAARHVPAGFSNPSGWKTLCQSFLILRGIVYWKNNLGDCGVPTPVGFTAATDTQLAGGVASGIAAMAGAALPGIGAAVQAITTIFQHHQQAVTTEQDVICGVAGVINQVIPYYDNQVRIGNLSPSDAYAGMQNYLAQVTAQLSTIQKVCDAACVYSAILSAHADFAQSYYPAIAPVQATPHAPGAPPAVYGTTPGGVVQVGATTGGFSSASPQLSTPLLATNPTEYAATTPAGLQDSTVLIAIVGVIILLFALSAL